MANLRVVSRNVVDTAAFMNSGSSQGSLVAANLRNDRKTEVWRAATNEDYLFLSWGVPVTVSNVTLAFTNFSPTALMNIKGWATSSDAGVNPPVFETGYVPCCPSPLVTSAPVGFGGGRYASSWFTEHTVGALAIEIDDPGNTDGYLQAGRLIVGAYWSPERNAESDSVRLSMQDDSKHTRAESGVLWTDRGPMYKKLSFDLSSMTAQDRNTMWRIIAGNGMSSSVFVSMMPSSTDAYEEQIHMIYGRMSSSSAITYKYMHLHATQLQLEEV